MPEVALILFPFQILVWSGETVIEKGIAASCYVRYF